MKKRTVIFILAALLGSQPVLPAMAESMEMVQEEAASETEAQMESETERERTEEELLVEKMWDGDMLEAIFIGKSFWCDQEDFEDIRNDLPEILLNYYQTEGIDTGELTAEDLRELIDTAYDSGISANVLELTSLSFGDAYEKYRDAVLTVFHDQAEAGFDEDVQLLEEGEYPSMTLMYKDDWYGERTDEERIALADKVLEVLETAGIEKTDYNGNTLAQAINDRYDQDAGDSVLYLAFDILGENELYISVLESIISCLQEVVYL